jgi:hypothetical protein
LSVCVREALWVALLLSEDGLLLRWEPSIVRYYGYQRIIESIVGSIFIRRRCDGDQVT